MSHADTIRKIRLETPHFVLRSIERGDATPEWTQWLTDPTAARMLNTAPRTMSMDEIGEYIASFDGKSDHLLGIFEKDGGTLVGIRAVHIDWQHKEFLINILVGETAARGKGARTETRDALYNFLFGDLELETARCSVLAHNAEVLRIMDENGWQHIHTWHKPSATGAAFVEVRDFSLSRDANRRGEEARALRRAMKPKT